MYTDIAYVAEKTGYGHDLTAIINTSLVWMHKRQAENNGPLPTFKLICVRLVSISIQMSVNL